MEFYFCGSAGGRTRDLGIKSPLLYQLSYRPVRAPGGIRTPDPLIRSQMLFH